MRVVKRKRQFQWHGTKKSDTKYHLIKCLIDKCAMLHDPYKFSKLNAAWKSHRREGEAIEAH